MGGMPVCSSRKAVGAAGFVVGSARDGGGVRIGYVHPATRDCGGLITYCILVPTAYRGIPTCGIVARPACDGGIAEDGKVRVTTSNRRIYGIGMIVASAANCAIIPPAGPISLTPGNR